MHKIIMRKILSTFLVIIGIVLICFPFASEFYVKYRQEKLYREMLDRIEKSTNNTHNNEDSSSNNTDTNNTTDDTTDNAVDIMDENFSMAIIQVEDRDNNKKEEKKEPDLDIIGRIEIDRLGINLIILEGSSQYILKYGAGHITNTAYPGEIGNFVLAGHRGYGGATFFYRLHKIKIGDEIKITYGDKVFKYIVNDSFKVLPSDLYVLEQPEDKKELTLITCDPPVSGTHRIIIKAQLLEDNDEE